MLVWGFLIWIITKIYTGNSCVSRRGIAKRAKYLGGEARDGASVQLLVNPLVFQPDLLKFRSGGLPVGHPLLQRTLHLDKLAVHGGEIDLAVAGKLFDQFRLALLERFELLLQIGNLLFGRLFPLRPARCAPAPRARRRLRARSGEPICISCSGVSVKPAARNSADFSR